MVYLYALGYKNEKATCYSAAAAVALRLLLTLKSKGQRQTRLPGVSHDLLCPCPRPTPSTVSPSRPPPRTPTLLAPLLSPGLPPRYRSAGKTQRQREEHAVAAVRAAGVRGKSPLLTTLAGAATMRLSSPRRRPRHPPDLPVRRKTWTLVLSSRYIYIFYVCACVCVCIICVCICLIFGLAGSRPA